MIIPALVEMYDRMASDPGSDIAPPGYSRQQISFKVVITKKGELHSIEPMLRSVPLPEKATGRGAAKSPPTIVLRPEKMTVPGQSKPSGSGINPCFLWDNSAYMLGFKPDDPKPERTEQAFIAFRDRHLGIRDEIHDVGFRAVCAFLEAWKPREAVKIKGLEDLVNNFGVFQLLRDEGYVHERDRVREWWEANAEHPEETGRALRDTAPSLASGNPCNIARLHEPKIKGVAGAQSSGAALVSFNQDAFTSYAKDQGSNAPVGVDEAFKYCTVLTSLTTSNQHRVRIAGDTFIFWSAGDANQNKELSSFFGATLDDGVRKDEVTSERLRGVMQRVQQGLPVKEFGDPATPFYILGLSPNMSRLSVRLWLVSSVGEIVSRLHDHFDALHMEPTPGNEPIQDGAMSIRRLVSETVPPKGGFPDGDRVNPSLVAEVMRSVLTGTRYPRALLTGVLDRVRMEGLADKETRNDYRDAQHRRCAIIRACLTRNNDREVPVSLDPNRREPGYLLGRLFAVLERVQENALGQINRTIKDTYYGAASSTPTSVFPRLISLSRHHLNKIEGAGQRVAREKELGSVMDLLAGFPRLLTLEEQGLFAIGYYHQRQSYFASKAPSSASIDASV